MPDARAEILGRIAKAVPSSAMPRRDAAWESIARDFRKTSLLDRAALLHLLTNRLVDYDAHVLSVAAEGIAEAVATLLTASRCRRIVIPHGIAAEMLPQGFDFVVDDNLTAAELDRFDAVLTLSTVAIAETGTIVLQNVAGQGRRAATLVPDVHVCIVRAEDVVETVPEAMARLQKTAALPTTFISGPSATADIEMTRIKGVHGPRFLNVVLSGFAGKPAGV